MAVRLSSELWGRSRITVRPSGVVRMQGGEVSNPHHLRTRERALADIETRLTIVSGDIAHEAAAQPPE